MTNGKIWLVVNPSVGIPVFLAAVAISSFAIHYNLYQNTTWMKSYYNGTGINAPAEPAPAPAG